MRNLEKLIKLTENFSKNYEWGGTLNIYVNEHKTCYRAIKDYLISAIASGNPNPVINISDEDWVCIEECEKSGNIYEIQLYNLTPNGHWSVFDSTMEGAALKMVKIIEEDADQVISKYKLEI